jgi:hypothetical protein
MSVVYHGSPVKIKDFKPMLGTNPTIAGKSPVDRNGYFFTPDLEVAKNYAGPTGFIHTATLQMDKPFDITNGIAPYHTKMYRDYGGDIDWLHSKDEPWKLMDGAEGKAFVDTLAQGGFDGVKYVEHNKDLNKDHETHIVFDPKQIQVHSIEPLNEDEAPTNSVGNQVIDTSEPVVTKEQQKKRIKSFKEFVQEKDW